MIPANSRLPRAFHIVWFGQTISLTGSAVTMIALPLTAILLLGATPLQMGIYLACSSGANAIFGLLAGAWSDRVRRRPLLILADVARAAAIGAIPTLYLLHLLRMEALYGVAVVMGAGNSLASAAYSGFLPTLVGRDRLIGANSRSEGSRVLAQVIGPGVGGALVQAISAPLTIVIDACSYLVSALCFIVIRAPEPQPTPEPERRLWRDIAAGLRVTFGHPLLRAMLIAVAIFNLFAPMLNAQLFLYATRELHLTSTLLGLGIVVSSCFAVGMAFVAGRVSTAIGTGHALTLAGAMIAGGWLIIPFIHGSMWLIVGLLALGAAIGTMGDVLFNINAATLRQTITPQHLQGRVTASMTVLILGMQPLGALIGGVLGEVIGERLTLGIAAGGFALGWLAITLSPLRRVRRPQDAAPVADTVAAEAQAGA